MKNFNKVPLENIHTYRSHPFPSEKLHETRETNPLFLPKPSIDLLSSLVSIFLKLKVPFSLPISFFITFVLETFCRMDIIQTVCLFSFGCLHTMI